MNNIPQGYKQTELGIIPEDWEVKSFSQIFDIYPNNTYSRDFMNDSCGVVRNIHYGDVLIKYPTIVDVEKCAIPYLNEDIKIKLQKLVQSGDIIIADTAEDETVGKCVEIKNVGNNKIVAGLHTFFCRPTAPFAEGWLGYYINSTNYHNQLIPYITGIKVSSISRTAIQETKLLVPPVAEQRAIAKALSDVDGLIAALDKKIAKKRLLKQGAMQQLLTGKKRLPGFTDEWVKRSLSQFGSFMSGNGFPVCFQGGKLGKYPFFKVSDFNNRGNERILMYSNNYISESTKEKLNCNIVPSNSVIFAKIGAAIFLERKRLSTKECCIDNNMMAFSPNEYIDANYICFLLQTISFGELVEATALPSLGAKIVGSIILKVPKTLNEQQAIAAILSDMDKEIADLEAQRDKYCLLKSGMMQKLLTGQIRLKTE